MNRRLKLALAAALGFSTACSSVRNASHRQEAGPAEQNRQADSVGVLPTVEIERPSIRVMYGVPRPRTDSAGRAAVERPGAANRDGLSGVEPAPSESGVR